MRIYLASCLAAAVIAVCAATVLSYSNEPVATAFATSSVRL